MASRHHWAAWPSERQNPWRACCLGSAGRCRYICWPRLFAPRQSPCRSAGSRSDAPFLAAWWTQSHNWSYQSKAPRHVDGWPDHSWCQRSDADCIDPAGRNRARSHRPRLGRYCRSSYSALTLELSSASFAASRLDRSYQSQSASGPYSRSADWWF